VKPRVFWLPVLILLIAFIGLRAAHGQDASVPAGVQPDRYLTITWKASPYLDGCADPVDGAGRAWHERDFDDSAWAVVSLPDETIPPYKTRYYRAHFDLAGDKPQAVLRFNSDDGSHVYVGGKHVGRWGADCGYGGVANPYDTDLTPWLTPGDNVIAIQVNNGGGGPGFLRARLRAGAGAVWTRQGGNPVVDVGLSGNWDQPGVGAPSVLREADGYRMWYSNAGDNHYIGLAYSADGKFWFAEKDRPVVLPGLNGDWDDRHVSSPAVIKDLSSYKLYYSGYDGANFRIGLATSVDGIRWEKLPTGPVLSIGEPGAPASASPHQAMACAGRSTPATRCWTSDLRAHGTPDRRRARPSCIVMVSGKCGIPAVGGSAAAAGRRSVAPPR
jgi:hypothetical protein